MTKTRDLSAFRGSGYRKGRPIWVQVLWLLASGTIVMPWWIPSQARVTVLRWFGASIGKGVLVRHRVRIHWPWKLTIGDNTWIGEGAWILNLEPVTIGKNVCISQDVLLCTGSHDRRSPTFEFDNAPIVIEDGAWIAARATILRGVTVGSRSTVGSTALLARDLPPDSILFAPIGDQVKVTSPQ